MMRVIQLYCKGGVADILVEDLLSDSTIEVTLMRNRQQATHEIPAITRHLIELRNESNKDVFQFLWHLYMRILYICVSSET